MNGTQPGRMPPTERKRFVDGGREKKVSNLLLIDGCRIVEWSYVNLKESVKEEGDEGKKSMCEECCWW